MQIRRMTMEDCAQVAAIETMSFSMPWSLHAFTETIDNSNYRFLVAEENGEILGYCGFVYVLDEAEIPNVCVSAEARRRGIGRALMEALVVMAKELRITTLHLEVRQSNEAAKHLYRSVGFEEIGIRKNFYELPKEDAVLMSKTL
ncbi:MAG: ribosomal-protein-alanine N-acetyltransferase [Lachnospiraceae bacterium]|nr:ribosomal-protein-alanine N-acetyltransferase [Lachnospiraceae bacterium]